jgi:C1A family cysteine protease
MEDKMKRSYGWKRDIGDQRDFKFSAIAPAPVVLPTSVDLRPGCSPVEDQGDIGACVSNALAGALEFMEKRTAIAPFRNLSRLFIYYNARAIDGTVKVDCGTSIRTALKGLSSLGVCGEPVWPYVPRKFAKKPCSQSYADALNLIVKTYHAISTMDEMKACLADGWPFAFGFSVYESFESDAVASTGIVPMPQPNERMIGGHAVLAVGYDDARGAMLIRNSWGPDFGIGGYFWLPYAFFTKPGMSSDFWTVR